MSTLKAIIKTDTVTAMKAKDSIRVTTLRMLSASIQKLEIELQTELSDAQILGVIEKSCKQRKESITQFQTANRPDLADNENTELVILEEYLPEQMNAQEIEDAVDSAINESGAQSSKDMGKVLGILKPLLAGKADMSAVSAAVKAKLAALA